MSGLTLYGTAEPIPRDQTARDANGDREFPLLIHHPCSADHKEGCKPYTVDATSAQRDDKTHNTDTVYTEVDAHRLSV